MTNGTTTLGHDDLFWRDTLYKMMGFGLAVLIVYMGWMVGTGDSEKFQRYSDENEMKAEAREIALRYGNEGSREYKIKLADMEETLQMRWDRTYLLYGMLVGTLFWFLTIGWAYWHIKDKKNNTVPHWISLLLYCVLVAIPQVIAVYLILKD